MSRRQRARRYRLAVAHAQFRDGRGPERRVALERRRCGRALDGLVAAARKLVSS